MKLEIGRKYHVYSGDLDFTGLLLDIYEDGTCFVESTGTMSRYRLPQNFLLSL